MKVLPLIFILAFITGGGCADTACGQTADRGQTNFIPVRVHRDFTGALTVKTREGPQTVPVSALAVAIENHQTVNVPKELASGLALIEFQSGEIQIKVGSRTERASGGEFLIVPADSNGTFTTADDTVSFTAVVFGDPLAKVGLESLKPGLVKAPVKEFGRAEGGVLSRRRLYPAAAGEVRIEVQDLLVGPSRKTDFMQLPGAALIQVTSGRGTMEQEGKSVPLQGGSFLTVEEGMRLRFLNLRSDLGLSMRATVLRAQ